jgi:NAD(P)-dependent dehydrogenase (short-subunit alcohol dehydrogenase family)
VTTRTRGFSIGDDTDLELTGKIVLVTGSTAGIGFAFAKSLASDGAHIYVNGRTQQRVDAAMAAIRSHAACSPIRDGFVFSGVIMNGAHNVGSRPAHKA